MSSAPPPMNARRSWSGRFRCLLLALLSSQGVLGPLPANGKDIGGSVEFASRIVLGHADGNWLGTTQTPVLHSFRLLGAGQVLGLGDTGVDTQTCSFYDPQHQVPHGTTSSSHRKIASYIPVGGDYQDSTAVGHGTHIAGIMVGKNPAASSDHGIAPEARLVVVDVEKVNQIGLYTVPYSSVDISYFDPFRTAQANIVCSPWSYEQDAVGVKETVNLKADTYAWNHPEFLAVFPSGNADPGAPEFAAMSPCVAKNVLCVGASYNALQMYTQQPSVFLSALQIGSDSCLGDGRQSCAEEIQAFPAIFGATKPADRVACRAALNDCLRVGTVCPECAFESQKLASVTDALAAAASPADGCTTLQNFPSGRVCVVQRGTCEFLQKAKHCFEAGAVGVVIVDSSGTLVLLDGDDTEIDGLGLIFPVMAVSKSHEAKLLAPGRRLTFPVVSQKIHPRRRVPYSRYGTPEGRAKPEFVVPGDGISSTAVGVSCGFKQMSGTSQSCGIAAGAAALVREYLLEWADTSQGRLSIAWSSTLRAALVTASEVDREGLASASTVLRPEVGFGLPALASLLPMPPGPGFIAVQSLADVSAQHFCLQLTPNVGAGALGITLAWTDPPSADGRLVHDLDLEVSCDVSSWEPLLGNGGTSPDRLNTVEKVSLLGYDSFTSGLCIATVRAPMVSAVSAQPFSLVVAGPFLLSSSCAPAVRARTCVNGVAEKMSSVWRCRCFSPYVGLDCSEEPEEIPVSSPTARRPASHLRPWQWYSFKAPFSCFEGKYTLSVEGPGDPELLKMTLSGGHLEVTGSDGVSSTPEVSITTSLQNTGADYARTAEVEVALGALEGEASLAIALQWQGRDRAEDVVIRWSSQIDGCEEFLANGGDEEGGSPVALILGFVAMIIAASVAGTFLIQCRRRSKVHPVQPVQFPRTGQLRGAASATDEAGWA